MNRIEKIKQFEKPIFDNYQLERNRIVSSSVFFNIHLSIKEFWMHFLDYVFDKSINLSKSQLKVGNMLHIKTDDNKINAYVISDYKENNYLELAHLKNDKLIKIFINTKLTKSQNYCDIEYIESIRTNARISTQKNKVLQKSFNSKVLNKAILLKDYLLKKVTQVQ